MMYDAQNKTAKFVTGYVWETTVQVEVQLAESQWECPAIAHWWGWPCGCITLW